jgi:hypothetical protein
VRDLTGLDLLQVLDGSLIDKLIRDPVLLCDVVYAACKPEADAQKVTDEQFGRAMAGDAIEHATSALLEELVSFCPSPRDRANLGRVLETTKRVMEKARDLVQTKLDSGELERIAEQALAQINQSMPENSSGNVPAFSGSIHPP